MARPKSLEPTRTVSYTWRLTKEEKEELEKRASACNLKLTDYLRKLASI